MVSTVRAAETRRAGMPVASTIVSVICSPSASAFRMACSSSVNSLACSLSRISRRAGASLGAGAVLRALSDGIGASGFVGFVGLVRTSGSSGGLESR